MECWCWIGVRNCIENDGEKVKNTEKKSEMVESYFEFENLHAACIAIGRHMKMRGIGRRAKSSIGCEAYSIDPSSVDCRASRSALPPYRP